MATARQPTATLLARALAAGGLALLLSGLVAVTLAARGSSREEQVGPAQATPQTRPSPPKPRPKRRPSAPLRALTLRAAGAYDPEGDGNENDELAAAAVDRNLKTSWQTERYSSFFKEGVGLVLDARRAATFARAVVSTDTPGFTAEIHVGAGRVGPFRAVSAARRVSGRTVFPLRRAGARYLVVWITDIPDGTAAHLTEVRVLVRNG